MQKKGIADYKGVFPTLEAARASNKVICLIPSRDGQTYEMRRSELGEFIAPKHKITEFSEVRAGFRPALPRIPQELLRSIIGFSEARWNRARSLKPLSVSTGIGRNRNSSRSFRSSALPRIVSRFG